jgi:hypothetical protein
MRCLAIILTVLLLAACGPVAKQPGPDAIPIPTGPAQPQPTLPPSSPTPDTLIFDNIPLQTYTHPGQRFSINYPANWQTFEQPTGVIFVDPTLRAAYGVLFSQAESPLPPPALNDFAVQFVQSNFGHETGFKILADDQDVIQFKSIDPNLGPAINEVGILSQGNTIYFTLVTVVEDMWAQSAGTVRDLTGSLQLHQVQTESISATPTPAEPPVWNLYTHPVQKIAFLYPNNWVITETEESVQTIWPEQQFVFAVEVVSSPGAGEDLEIVETFTQEQADRLAARYDDFEMLPLTSYQVGRTTGYTVDHLYTNAEGIPIAGSIIAVGIDDNIYHISISAPAPTYKVSLDWFNPMMQSFQILREENLGP